MRKPLRVAGREKPGKTASHAGSPTGYARPVRSAVIIPAGPRDDILDTLASVVEYTDPSRIIVVIDDTGTLAARSAHIRDLSEDIVVIPPPATVPGILGGLWVKVAVGYTWLLERFRPGIILRMDADALMLGRGIEPAAEKLITHSVRSWGDLTERQIRSIFAEARATSGNPREANP